MRPRSTATSRSRTVLITGAAGFTGVNLVRAFARAGDAVVAVDRIPADGRGVMFWYEERKWRYLRASRRTPREERRDAALPDRAIDIAIHAAAVTNPRGEEEIERASDSVSANAGATVNLMRWAQRARPSRVIYLSSSSPYGARLKGSEPLDETAPVEPDNVYAITKYAGELLALRLGKTAGVQVALARFTSAYGPMERTTLDRRHVSVIAGWCAQAMRCEAVVADLAQPPRDYTYVDDVAAAIAALATPVLLHCCTTSRPGRFGCREMIAALGEQFPGMRVSFVGEESAPDSLRRPLSPERLRAETGWSPRYDIRSGLGVRCRPAALTALAVLVTGSAIQRDKYGTTAWSLRKSLGGISILPPVVLAYSYPRER